MSTPAPQTPAIGLSTCNVTTYILHARDGTPIGEVHDEALAAEIAHRYNAFPALLEALARIARAAIAAAQRPEEGA